MKLTALVLGIASMAALTAAAVAAEDRICGDVNRSGSVTASDALSVLKAAVGQNIALLCGPPGQALKTGQTLCYDATGLSAVPCTGTGQDGEERRGIGNEFTDNGDGTVTDATTGLMWEKLSNDGSVHDWDNTYSWANAFGKIASLNDAEFAGHEDWRLPNVTELESLRNFGTSQPATYGPFHNACMQGCTVTSCSCTKSFYYWTSSYSHYGPPQAWFVDFLVGNTFADNKVSAFHVRAVRIAS